jgi:riboflavin synthase
MFTGIVTHVGRVKRAEPRDGGGMRLAVESGLPADALEVGASVAHDGCCLTVVEAGEGWHAADASGETLARTTLADWAEGRAVNLEAAARFGDPIGGHIVTGHVDGVGSVAAAETAEGAIRVSVDAPTDLAPLIAEKGSIAMDGVSLTVNGVEGSCFWVSIIPHTAAATTLGGYAAGRRVNLEIDPLARYVARVLAAGSSA